MNEKEFALAVKDIGGCAYAVGGLVRDRIMKRASKDSDYVVTGVTEEIFVKRFPLAERVGGNFPIYLVEIDEKKREVAFARNERKTGRGYKGFSVVSNPAVTIEDDLRRRDLTINSMACSLLDDALIDPFGGEKDINDKTLRATSEHFSEDPVRALRTARQAAELEFAVEPRTVELMAICKEELRFEPKERIFMELKKALESRRPSIFFRSLRSAGLLAVTFIWLFDMVGKAQPLCSRLDEDAFEHTMFVLDRVSMKTERIEVRFAALAHDIGKGVASKELLPHDYRYEKKGLEILSDINKQFCLPRVWKQCAELAIREHTSAPYLTKPEDIRDLLVTVSRHPLGFDGFNEIIKADCGILPRYLAEHGRYMAAINTVQSIAIPENLKGMEIGVWRRRMEIQALAGVWESERRTSRGGGKSS